MSVTIADLFSIPDIQPEDLLHILDASNSNEDDKVNIGALTTYLNTALDIPQTIASVNGLQAALDGKADIVHTHTVAQVIGLQADLDAKTDVTQAQIIGRNIVLNGKSINVPSTIGGLQDDRIPSTVVVGEYLQFDTTGGGISNITGDTLKGNIGLNLVNNTADISKPVSTAQQSALDLKVDTSTYNTGQAAQDTNIATNASDIATNATAIALNTQKVSFDAVSSAKLDGIEALADVTDTENVWGSLGISGSGSTGQFLTQRGVFVGAPNVSVNKSQIDAAIGASPGGNTTLFYNQAGAFTAPEGGDEVTKQAIDNAIGVFPTGDSAQFYNEQGNFVDAQYDSIENAPIIRNATVESIVLSGTRSNVQARLTGVSELSVITMQNTFDSSPTQYTTTFTSPNTTFTPSLVFPAGSQGRQLSLTEADGTLHRFCYLVNGNYRLLDGGLTGTVRLGPVAVATTATVTAAVTVPDQTAGQTITLAGDETGTFSVGDFISPQANNFGAYRGIFVDSITFDGTNTVIVGPSNGATTFQTTSVLRNAGPATEIQGTIPTFSGDPDTANTVYSSSIPATEFTVLGVDTSAHLIQVANAYAALETAITTDGVVTDNGDGTSSITVNYNTETNIDSSFTITGGLNNMESIVNVDGMIGDLSPATTITVIDPEATEVASFTSSAADTSVNNVDEIAAQIVLAVNSNIETPINFDAEYDTTTNTIILTADEAGNTNPWTIVFDNNGTTGVNAGDLGYTSSQTGDLVNQLDTSVIRSIGDTTNHISFLGSNVFWRSQGRTFLNYLANSGMADDQLSISSWAVQVDVEEGYSIVLQNDMGQLRVPYSADVDSNVFNQTRSDMDFEIRGDLSSTTPFYYDAGNHTITTDATLIGFGGGADGLSITDTVNLNLLDGTTVLSTVVLPSSSGTTVIVGTANEIINTVSGDTNTLSLAPAITDAITANTAKTGITTAQADAITSNTGKTGITVAQSNAIIANTSKTGITTAQATAITNNTAKVGITTAQASAITANTAKVSNVDILPLNNTFTGNNTFSAVNGLRSDSIRSIGSTDTNLIFSNTTNNSGFTLSNGNHNAVQSTYLVSSGDSNTTITGTNILTLSGGDSSSPNNISIAENSTTINPFNFDVDFTINKQTTGVAFSIDSGADVMTIGSDVLTINSTTINGLPSKADALSISGQVLSLLDGTTSLSTVTLPSGGTATTVLGTTGEIDVNTVGTNATVSISSTITDAIDLNTAKQSVAGLTQVGGAIIGTDSVLYYDGTVPRRKVFSSVPLSVMNNDSGFITGITKANVDTAVGASAGGDAALFYNQQGAFVAAGGVETGTWTPGWTNAGAVIPLRAVYSKSGQTVTLTVSARVATGTSMDVLSISSASLPFSSTFYQAAGSFFTSPLDFGNIPDIANISASGPCILSTGTIFFLDSTTNDRLIGTSPTGYIGFTITYETT